MVLTVDVTVVVRTCGRGGRRGRFVCLPVNGKGEQPEAESFSNAGGSRKTPEVVLRNVVCATPIPRLHPHTPTLVPPPPPLAGAATRRSFKRAPPAAGHRANARPTNRRAAVDRSRALRYMAAKRATLPRPPPAKSAAAGRWPTPRPSSPGDAPACASCTRR